MPQTDCTTEGWLSADATPKLLACCIILRREEGGESCANQDALHVGVVRQVHHGTCPTIMAFLQSTTIKHLIFCWEAVGEKQSKTLSLSGLHLSGLHPLNA